MLLLSVEASKLSSCTVVGNTNTISKPTYLSAVSSIVIRRVEAWLAATVVVDDVLDVVGDQNEVLGEVVFDDYLRVML